MQEPGISRDIQGKPNFRFFLTVIEALTKHSGTIFIFPICPRFMFLVRKGISTKSVFLYLNINHTAFVIEPQGICTGIS